MNDKFNEQKDFLTSIKQEINLLQQQVDYLIRNEQPLGLLDLDVMMNRVHTIYDKMCSVNLESEQMEVRSEESKDSMEEELPVGVEEIRSLFGIEAEEDEIEEEDELEEDIVEEPKQPSEEEPEENEDAYFVEEVEEVEEEPEATAEEPEALEEEPAQLPDVQTSETQQVVSETEENTDDFGFILDFQPVEEKHDNEFELDSPETLGDRYQQSQEETLGEKLQHGNVKDLQSAIGINDKFLFVNELFGGSMEKYNRSIENLNDLKTLNGALIYLNELRIELQWNSSNEAYKKLLELVHRKFEA